MKDAHDALKLEAARDKAVLAGQRSVFCSFEVPLWKPCVMFYRLASSVAERSSKFEEREIGNEQLRVTVTITGMISSTSK